MLPKDAVALLSKVMSEWVDLFGERQLGKSVGEGIGTTCGELSSRDIISTSNHAGQTITDHANMYMIWTGLYCLYCQLAHQDVWGRTAWPSLCCFSRPVHSTQIRPSRPINQHFAMRPS